MTDLKVEYKNIKELIPYCNNSRTHSDDQVLQIASSIKEFGFTNPVLIDGQGGIIAGHGRIMAAQKLKMDEVPTITLSDLSEAQKKAYIIADNKLALNSGWDDELLKIELEQLKELDFDLGLIGFSDDELALLMGGETTEGLVDEDQVPELVDDPVTVLGDVWLLGNHRLMCGDSTSIDAVERLMDGQKADMVFTDPPYRQETEGGCVGSIGAALKKQEKEIESLCDFDPELFLGNLPFVFDKNKMNAYVFCNKDLLPDYLVWAKDSGYSFNVLIWKKPNAIPIGGSHRPDIEYLLIFRRSAIFNGGISGVSYSKVLEHAREKNKVHPTMKPVEMIENQIQISSVKNSLVVDLFLGSGSTLIACEKNNRQCLGMELDPKYCDVIIKRFQDFTGKQATLESNGKTYNELLNDNQAQNPN